MFKISPIALSLLFSVNSFAQSSSQSNSNIDIKVSVDAGCFINVNNINFGALMIPLTTQTATSEMSVLCSKNSNYTIGVSYSATGAASTSYTGSLATNGSGGSSYYISDSNGNPNNQPYTLWVQCFNNGTFSLYTGDSALFRSIYGINSSVNVYNSVPDTYSICNGSSLNMTTLSGYSTGKLTGINKNEIIQYTLELPGATSVWNTSNKYTGKGTGENQTIPMKAKINTSGSPTHMLSPDNYIDTLTVLLAY